MVHRGQSPEAASGQTGRVTAGAVAGWTVGRTGSTVPSTVPDISLPEVLAGAVPDVEEDAAPAVDTGGA
jgi:hypothetical protein